MKAVICEQYGGPEVLKVKEINVNTPGDDDLLITNYAASITTADTFMRKGEPKFGRLFLGLKKPKNNRTGTGFAGIVAKAGKNVKAFKVGDRVYGETIFSFGANAEMVCINVNKSIVQHIPQNFSFKQAAPICDGILTSYNFLVDLAKLAPNQHILINGASGALGTAAIQIAKSIGAKVTAVCSAQNSSLVKDLADKVIDYHKNDFCKNHDTYHVIYDTIGASSFSKSKKALKKGGTYLSPVLSFGLLLTMLKTSLLGSKKAKFQATGMRKPAELNPFLQKINLLIEQGDLTTFVDKTYEIDEIVAAHKYLDTGRKRGNIALVFN